MEDKNDVNVINYKEIRGEVREKRQSEYPI